MATQPSRHFGRIRRGLGRRWRLAIGLLIVLALAIILAMSIHKDDQQKAELAAEQFVLAMQSDDADRAYDMGDQDFRAATTQNNLDQMFGQVRPFVQQARIDKVDSYYATSAKGEPRAIIVYTATKGSRTTYIRLVMDHQKKDGKWLVHSLISKARPLPAKPE